MKINLLLRYSLIVTFFISCSNDENSSDSLSETDDLIQQTVEPDFSNNIISFTIDGEEVFQDNCNASITEFEQAIVVGTSYESDDDTYIYDGLNISSDLNYIYSDPSFFLIYRDTIYTNFDSDLRIDITQNDVDGFKGTFSGTLISEFLDGTIAQKEIENGIIDVNEFYYYKFEDYIDDGVNNILKAKIDSEVVWFYDISHSRYSSNDNEIISISAETEKTTDRSFSMNFFSDLESFRYFSYSRGSAGEVPFSYGDDLNFEIIENSDDVIKMNFSGTFSNNNDQILVEEGYLEYHYNNSSF